MTHSARFLAAASVTFTLLTSLVTAQQAVSTNQFLVASQTAFQERTSVEETAGGSSTDFSDYYMVEDTAAEPGKQSFIQDALVEPTQARSGDQRNTTRTASRSRRSSRTPYMIGDSPYDEFHTGSMQAGGFAIEGLDIVSVNHPAFNANRFNASEAGSFMPTDRFIFTYRHLHNASSTNYLGNLDTVDVDRFLLGVEKTALDGMVSAEFRMPLLVQLDSDLTIAENGSAHRDVELGNLSVTLKALLANRRKFAVAAGLAVNIPTAKDFDFEQSVEDAPIIIDEVNGVTGMANFGTVGRFKNDTVSLIPYLAWVVRPTPRFFQQGFFQIDAPLNSSEACLDVSGNITPDTDYSMLDITSTTTGEFERQTLLRLNMGFGYWLKQGRKQGVPTGLAALFEVHYTTNLDNANTFVAPLGTLNDPSATLDDIDIDAIAGDAGNDFDVVNLSSGLALDLGGCVITNGIVVPVTDDRVFDFEYNLQINKRF